MKLPGRENKTAVVVGTITDDVRVQEVPKLKVCALRVTSRARSRISEQGARSSLSTGWPWTPPRAAALSCSPVLTKAERCTGISARPQEPRTATPNPTSAPRAGSSSVPEADGPAEATKTNLGSYPLIKKILNADQKKKFISTSLSTRVSEPPRREDSVIMPAIFTSGVVTGLDQ
ncbi:uncharacterized protein LOC103878946 [Papio anubis]|uniref:Large ribosomal subunit protein uL15/eL18 domain-containing protein n=1 Tax=Papio anubis TaxID=9555 RepID=A0A8I5NAA7_PAPAN|nr:uncharacterized protein LOC103878946 [Papio anubis]